MDSLSRSGNAMRTAVKLRIVLTVLVTVTGYGLSRIPASFIYSLEATCHDAPESDDELRAWLAEQPGVLEHAIIINRYKTGQIELHLMVVQDSWGNPPFPDVNSKCTDLGYDISRPFAHMKLDQ